MTSAASTASSISGTLALSTSQKPRIPADVIAYLCKASITTARRWKKADAGCWRPRLMLAGDADVSTRLGAVGRPLMRS